MIDLYKMLVPVFTGETMTSAIRQVGLVRQRHLLAALREDPPSAELALSTMRCQHTFLAELCKAFVEEGIPDNVCDALGFHSLMFFTRGRNHCNTHRGNTPCHCCSYSAQT